MMISASEMMKKQSGLYQDLILMKTHDLLTHLELEKTQKDLLLSKKMRVLTARTPFEFVCNFKRWGR